jgi:hypothetical protein
MQLPPQMGKNHVLVLQNRWVSGLCSSSDVPVVLSVIRLRLSVLDSGHARVSELVWN